MVAKGPVPEPEAVAPTVEVNTRFVVALLRCLTKLLRPEVVGIAVLSAAAEVGMSRKEALQLAQRFMIEARVPKKGWRPWPWGDRAARE
jgi:hypothetical protein